jgi:hypothetical protein
VLAEILRDGGIRGSNNRGFVKGNRTAVCFTEVPLSGVRYFVDSIRYSHYGIAISKKTAFEAGGRPVIYLPDAEGAWIPEDQRWRHVRFEYGSVDWTHEREWRLQGDFDIRSAIGFYILVWHPGEVDRLKEVTEGYSNIRGYLPMYHLLSML